jgi:hypothetical protein
MKVILYLEYIQQKQYPNIRTVYFMNPTQTHMTS